MIGEEISENGRRYVINGPVTVPAVSPSFPVKFAAFEGPALDWYRSSWEFTVAGPSTHPGAGVTLPSRCFNTSATTQFVSDGLEIS